METKKTKIQLIIETQKRVNNYILKLSDKERNELKNNNSFNFIADIFKTISGE